MDENTEKMLGMDKCNEIITLWYEINFLRCILNSIIKKNPDFSMGITQEVVDYCREESKRCVTERFPFFNVQFNSLARESTVDEKEEKKEVQEEPPEVA